MTSGRRLVGDGIEGLPRRPTQQAALRCHPRTRSVARKPPGRRTRSRTPRGPGRPGTATTTWSSAPKGLLGNRRPVGRKQISRVRRFLINVLTNEIRLGHLSSNVALASGDPGHLRQHPLCRRGLRRDRWSSSSDRRGAPEALVQVASGANLDPGRPHRAATRSVPAEARSLRWADLDLNAGELSVTGQQDRSNRRTRTKRRVRNARRTISIDRLTLRASRSLAGRPGAVACQGRSRCGTSSTSSPPQPEEPRSTATTGRDRSASSAVSAGIDPPIDPYELRHTAISLQAEAGRSSFEIADWAGTSEEMISRVYRHRLKRVTELKPDGW